jgi:adenylosuccinate lyase
MELHPLTAISPLDGRYRSQLQQLGEYFSEYALIKYRIQVEVSYLIFLSEKKFFSISPDTKKYLLALVENFNIEDALEIKKIERTTNHDVKAVEYFLKTKLKLTKDAEIREWVHFGLTSQDIK